MENQDAIDTAIVGTLADPKEVHGFFYQKQDPEISSLPLWRFSYESFCLSYI